MGKPSEKFYTKTPAEEGKRLRAYKDIKGPGAVWTLGFGNTTMPDGRPVREGDVITEEQAVVMFRDYVERRIQPKLDKFPHLKQNEIDALASLAYNTGEGVLENSTLATVLTAMEKETDPVKDWGYRNRVAYELMKWVYDNNKQPTLYGRRRREAEIFLEGVPVVYAG